MTKVEKNNLSLNLKFVKCKAFIGCWVGGEQWQWLGVSLVPIMVPFQDNCYS